MTDLSSCRVAVVDVEGNGQQPPDLVELAVVPIDGGVIGAPRTWLVRPARPITAIAHRIHGITNNAVAELPAIDSADAEIRDVLDGRVVAAHNAGVDIAVLRRELTGWEPSAVLDTLQLSRKALNGIVGSFELGRIAGTLGLAKGLPAGLAPHRATYDALICANLLLRLAGTPDGVRALAAAAGTDRLF